MTRPSADDITDCFNRLFFHSHDVELVGGGAEPLYLPATSNRPARIQFTHDYVSSALHEVAHWCIAGKHRRAAVDYGYWYQPPPRDPRQQQAFAAVEARVQALEAVFAETVQLEFRISIDDVDNLMAYETCFSRLVMRERQRWSGKGLTVRAESFRTALNARFGAHPGRTGVSIG